MLVSEWMTPDPLTVTPDTSVMTASQVMKENNIRRLPVTSPEGKLVGIISDRDLKDASPSKATTLDVHELYYLLSELKVKDIMSRRVITIGLDQTVEKAAVIMLEHKITGLPVVDGDKLVGIISQGDVFRVLTTITGIYRGSAQFAIVVRDMPGSIQEVADVFRRHHATVVSILSSYDMVEEGYRHVYLRVGEMSKKKLEELTEDIKREFDLLYMTLDDLSDI